MQRAVKKTVDWMFSVQKLHRIMAAYIPHNEKSGKVLSALGFEKEGKAKVYNLLSDSLFGIKFR